MADTKVRTIRLKEDADPSYYALLRTARKEGDEESVNNYVYGMLAYRGLKFEIVDNEI